jgi:hypothetical protein
MCIKILRSIDRKLDEVIGLLKALVDKEIIISQATDTG